MEDEDVPQQAIGRPHGPLAGCVVETTPLGCLVGGPQGLRGAVREHGGGAPPDDVRVRLVELDGRDLVELVKGGAE